MTDPRYAYPKPKLKILKKKKNSPWRQFYLVRKELPEPEESLGLCQRIPETSEATPGTPLQ